MAQTICCPCGTPIDCDHVELVITATCPRCDRELPLELDHSFGARRAMLTIMEGPHWVGEQFIMPVGAALSIGRASGNWLCLDAADIADTHCRLTLAASGAVIVEDLNSPAGTWIGPQRIVRGHLAPTGSLRVGPFRFRFDIQTPEGRIVAPDGRDQSDSELSLPTMASVKRKNSPAQWAARNRFILARWIILTLASIGGADFTLHLRARPPAPWNWNKALIAGALVWLITSFAGRHVTLIHNYLKYASLGLTVALALVGLSFGAGAFATASLCAAAGLVVLIMREPQPWLAFGGALIGAFGLIVLTRDLTQLIRIISSGG
ncbi:MAG: FHA domain-containing protein [Planctomycetia bacterium]|nr:MAG: FHA domain-containing protein [Planctomycetia bacterium]